MKKLLATLVAVASLTACADTETYRTVRDEGNDTCSLVLSVDKFGTDRDTELVIPCEIPYGDTVLFEKYGD